ncbi:MAG: rhodanese-like domain-containing protein [Spirochaetales bacterium]|nr:rhodanese-like domain-containing protein [Spirochaetales bacterium]
MVLKINTSQLKVLLQSLDRFALVDARPIFLYAQERIPGSVSLPEGTIEAKAPALLEKDDTIIVYGKNMKSRTGARAAAKLSKLGYRNVIIFPGGLDDYRRTGLPLEGKLHGAAPVRGAGTRETAGLRGAASRR